MSDALFVQIVEKMLGDAAVAAAISAEHREKLKQLLLSGKIPSKDDLNLVLGNSPNED